MNEILDTAQKIGEFLAVIMISLFFCKQYLEKYFKKKDISKLIPKQNKIDLNIVQKMEYTKEILNADRIHVYEFHNGDDYSDHRPAFKFSCTYEVFKAGNQPVQQLCTKLPTNCMPLFVNEIMEKNLFVCKNIEEIKDSMPSTYNFKKALKIEAFYDVAIKNSHGNIIGFIAIHWFNKNNMIVNDEVIKQLVWFIEEHLKSSFK